MMTQQIDPSNLAAPVAAIDRRSLSQAWYSALHVAQSSTPYARQSERNHPGGGNAFAVSALERDDRHAPPRAQTPVLRRGSDARLGTREEIEGKATAHKTIAPLIRQIERRFSGTPSVTRRATFKLGQGAARIHVILQTTGSTATLVAICRPEMRIVVARALAGARLALAARGIVVDVPAERGIACS